MELEWCTNVSSHVVTEKRTQVLSECSRQMFKEEVTRVKSGVALRVRERWAGRGVTWHKRGGIASMSVTRTSVTSRSMLGGAVPHDKSLSCCIEKNNPHFSEPMNNFNLHMNTIHI